MEGIEADEAAAEGEEDPVDVGAALVADGRAAVAVEPGEGSLDDPAVAAQALARECPQTLGQQRRPVQTGAMRRS